MLKQRIKTMLNHPPHRYSAEQVISSLMEDSSSSSGLDSDDSDTNSEKSEKSRISSPCSNVFNNKLSTPETMNDKQYTELKPVTHISTSTSIPNNSSSKWHPPDWRHTPSPPPTPVNLETQSDSSYPLLSDPSSHSIYSSTDSPNSSPTFPSDNSSSSNLTPLFYEDNFSDVDMDSDSLTDFQLNHDNPHPESQTVHHKRALFHVAEIPFDTLCQMVKTYLESIDKDPTKPVQTVPDMDRNQKHNSRKKTEKFKLINIILKHHHIYINENNKVKRGNSIFFNSNSHLKLNIFHIPQLKSDNLTIYIIFL